MFGYVNASWKELSKDEQNRYQAAYCGICRRIREQSSNLSRLSLSYDMAFLALLLMSLYEPEEQGGDNACMLHPIRHKPWLDSEYIRYCADMNVALAYFNCLDDWRDDRNVGAKWMAGVFGKRYPEIESRYPRQCGAIRSCLEELSGLETKNCPNPDEVAGCFGRLMAELFVYHEDHWEPYLRQMGMGLGRFIYLLDAAVDYRWDKRKGKYNPYLAMGMEEDWVRWEEYLVLALGSCTRAYEMLPLVQDKGLLDNILYSGVWTRCPGRRKEGSE